MSIVNLSSDILGYMATFLEDKEYYYPFTITCKKFAEVARKIKAEKVKQFDRWVVNKEEKYQTDSNGIKNGKWIIYFEDGKTMQSYLRMKKNKKHGQCITFHKNGDIREIMPFTMNCLDGWYECYFKGGRLKCKINYKLGDVIETKGLSSNVDKLIRNPKSNGKKVSK